MDSFFKIEDGLAEAVNDSFAFASDALAGKRLCFGFRLRLAN
jgi:hypothetical protein